MLLTYRCDSNAQPGIKDFIGKEELQSEEACHFVLKERQPEARPHPYA